MAICSNSVNVRTCVLGHFSQSDSLGGRKEEREGERREKGKNEETDMKLCTSNLRKDFPEAVLYEVVLKGEFTRMTACVDREKISGRKDHICKCGRAQGAFRNTCLPRALMRHGPQRNTCLPRALMRRGLQSCSLHRVELSNHIWVLSTQNGARWN